MPGEGRAQNPGQVATVTLEGRGLWNPRARTWDTELGDTMTNQAKPNLRYPACPRVQRIQDFLLLSSFGLWAAVLGLPPVLALHLLMAN